MDSGFRRNDANRRIKVFANISIFNYPIKFGNYKDGAGSKPVHVRSPCRIRKSTRKFNIDKVIFQVELGGYTKSCV
jgi:hypothetical protein